MDYGRDCIEHTEHTKTSELSSPILIYVIVIRTRGQHKLPTNIHTHTHTHLEHIQKKKRDQSEK